MNKKRLTLLGVWNILPVGTWAWSNDIMTEQIKRLTGVKLGIFYHIKNDLVYECFLKESTNSLRNALEELNEEKQIKYVKRIRDDYYELAKPLSSLLDETEKLRLVDLSNNELSQAIMNVADAWSKCTGQCWYAVLLDIWYPKASDHEELKKIIAPARDHGGHLHERSDKIEHQMYLEAAKRLGLTERDIYFMIQPEIAEALHGKKISKKMLHLREKLWVQSNESGKTEVYEGKKAEQLMEQYDMPTVGSKRIDLNGTPACPGKVRGIAKVILLDKEFSDFREGEILVSLQTMVHYTPIMKKSSAILTEFGGLTSHAAIVSRELKKPCIVGISGLISSIKTGDEIEVDAHKGIVVKLK